MAFSNPICLAVCLLPSQKGCISLLNIFPFEKKNNKKKGSFTLRNIVNIKVLSWQLVGCDEKLNKNIWIQNTLSDIISFQYFLERFYEDKTNFCGQLYAFILSLTGYRSHSVWFFPDLGKNKLTGYKFSEGQKKSSEVKTKCCTYILSTVDYQ